MAITGISAISGEQLIAAGALSARSAGTASYTTGGNDIQGLYNTVSDNSASWTGGGSVSITSPSGTIFVTDGDKVEGTNSAVRIGIVEEGYRSNDKTIDFWQTGISSDAYSDAFRILPSPNVRPFNSKIVFSGLGQNVGDITLTVTGYNSAWESVTAYTTFNDNGQLQQIEANLSGIYEQVGIMASDVIYFQGGYDTWYVKSDPVYGVTGIGELAWNSAVSSKLDTTAFSTVSGNFLTAHQDIAKSADWNSTTNTVSSNSASWGAGSNPFPASITTGSTEVAIVTTGFQDNTATRPTLFISGTTATNNYPRMLLSENHAAAQTSKSGAFLSDAFEFYTGKNGGSTKILRIDSTGMSGNAGFVFNKANHDKWNGVYNTVSSNSGSWTGGGASYTGDVQGALDEVYTNSATWLASLDVNNIVLTASLPGTPDTGTLYLIPET